jgi:replicative DNA helicase
MALGIDFLAACLIEQNTYNFLNHGDMEHLFRVNEKPVYDYVKGYVKTYGKMPSTETVELHTKEELPLVKDAPGYFYDQLVNRYTATELKLIMQEANKSLSPLAMDPTKALKTMTDGVMKLVTRRFDRKIVDFRDAIDIVYTEYIKTMQGDDDRRFFTGWPYIDDMSGGLNKGDLLSFVGRPAMGKTWQMLFTALFGWQDKFDEEHKVIATGQSRMFISMEMKPLPILQRLTSIQLSMPYSEIDKAMLSNHAKKKLKDGLTEVKGFGAPFWVVDGNLAATVEDVYLLARQLQPDAIIIDGGYLLKHPTVTDRYQRVAENADLIKSELCELAPTAVSWQFARSKNKSKKGEAEKKDLEDIGYTDAIGQISSLVLGLMQKESIETVVQRIIDVLKGRKGETGQFVTNWDFLKMDFTEFHEPDVSDLQFV